MCLLSYPFCLCHKVVSESSLLACCLLVLLFCKILQPPSNSAARQSLFRNTDPGKAGRCHPEQTNKWSLTVSMQRLIGILISNSLISETTFSTKVLESSGRLTPLSAAIFRYSIDLHPYLTESREYKEARQT